MVEGEVNRFYNKLISIKNVLVETFIEFTKEKSFIHCAALSYYTVLTLVPIIYLGFISVGKIIGQSTMVEIISRFLHDNIGITDTSGIIDFLETVDFEHGNVVVEIFGLILILFSSSALFKALKTSINEYMNINRIFKTKRKKIIATIQTRLVSMLMLAFFGFVIILAYFSQTILISFGNMIFTDEGSFLTWFYHNSAQHGLAIASNVIIFMLVFKYLHDGFVEWKVAFIGSLFTSFLLYFGQLLIKYYLTTYFFARDGGLAGSMLIILVWMYYSAHIIFLGAKFTAIYGKRTNRPVRFD